jgi:FdhE protein
MRSTAATNRTGEARSRLAQEQRHNPEWGPWLRLLEQAIAALDDVAWSSVRVQRAPHSPGAPLLDGALVTVDARAATAWTHHLIESAAAHMDGRAPALILWATRDFDALRVLEAGIRQDVQSLPTFGGGGDGAEDTAALAAVSQLAVLPLLHACRKALDAQQPTGWTRGCCRICGGWPTLAELRGLDRTRNLRCGRCGEDWLFQLLRCPYCDETDHAKLGSLAAEDGPNTLKVDTCRTCGGYVKTFTTLRATPDWALLVEDLATIPLDIVAHERGFSRPDQAACRMSVRLAPEEPREIRLEYDA